MAMEECQAAAILYSPHLSFWYSNQHLYCDMIWWAEVVYEVENNGEGHFMPRCGSRYFNQWIWAKNLKSVKTFRKSLVTYMKRFEANNHVFSVRLCRPEAIFWPRGEMMGQNWEKSEIHHFSIIGYNSSTKCAIWVHNTILETSGHLL